MRKVLPHNSSLIIKENLSLIPNLDYKTIIEIVILSIKEKFSPFWY